MRLCHSLVINEVVTMSDDLFEDAEEEEFLLDEVSGRKRKPVMSALNKTKLSRYEMDDIFA